MNLVHANGRVTIISFERPPQTPWAVICSLRRAFQQKLFFVDYCYLEAFLSAYEGEAELEASDFATAFRPSPGIAGTSTLLGVVS